MIFDDDDEELVMLRRLNDNQRDVKIKQTKGRQCGESRTTYKDSYCGILWSDWFSDENLNARITIWCKRQKRRWQMIEREEFILDWVMNIQGYCRFQGFHRICTSFISSQYFVILELCLCVCVYSGTKSIGFIEVNKCPWNI